MIKDHTYYLARFNRFVGPRIDMAHILYGLYLRHLPSYYPDDKPFVQDGASYFVDKNNNEFFTVVANCAKVFSYKLENGQIVECSADLVNSDLEGYDR